MNDHAATKLAGIATLLVMATSAQAAAPPSLYNKSIKISWTETRSQRVRGEAEFRSVSIPISLAVYISSKGQIFRRHSSFSASRRAAGSKDRVGADTSGSDGAGQVSFQGNTMVSTTNNGGLGRRIRVTFSGASSCNAEILTGKAGGGSQGFRSVATGKMMELQSVSAGAASCSVQDGNVFAD